MILNWIYENMSEGLDGDNKRTPHAYYLRKSSLKSRKNNPMK